MIRTALAALAAIAISATAAHGQSYTLTTSWPVDHPGRIASDGSSVLVLSDNGARVTRYDLNGSQVDEWATNPPASGGVTTGRGLGVDGSGFVYVLTFRYDDNASPPVTQLVQKFASDGAFISSQVPTFDGHGFAVDAAGNIYGGDDNYGDPTTVFCVGPDGTLYYGINAREYQPLLSSGPSTMAPSGQHCGGLRERDRSCFDVDAAAATVDRLFLLGGFCDDEGACTYGVRVYGDGATLLSSFPVDPYSLGVVVDSQGAAYVLHWSAGGFGENAVEKWVASGATTEARASWGTIKARWR